MVGLAIEPSPSECVGAFVLQPGGVRKAGELVHPTRSRYIPEDQGVFGLSWPAAPETVTQLWQMDVMGGAPLEDATELKVVTGIDAVSGDP
jgi:hypothetical protein